MPVAWASQMQTYREASPEEGLGAFHVAMSSAEAEVYAAADTLKRDHSRISRVGLYTGSTDGISFTEPRPRVCHWCKGHCRFGIFKQHGRIRADANGMRGKSCTVR